MSYTEYTDLFIKAQKKKCPFRAFAFDIINSRNQKQYIEESENHHNFVLSIYDVLKQEEKRTGKKILLDDESNLKYHLSINSNVLNPMILGDMVTYFVYEDSISSQRMIELFCENMKLYNISYPFHFSTGVYETNTYSEGGEKLFKGYMPSFLENLGKKNGLVVTNEGLYDENENTK